MLSARLKLVLCILVGGGFAAAFACGTDAIGVETCRKVEAARCRRAATCSDYDLTKPIHTGDDVDACVRFYDEACLHGLTAATDIGAVAADKCVNSIAAATCDDLKPENLIRLDGCAGLASAPPPDASAPVDATDVAPDASGSGG